MTNDTLMNKLKEYQKDHSNKELLEEIINLVEKENYKLIMSK
jgi:hypothetical protein